MQCDYDYGDINNDNFLDVIDVTGFVDFIIDDIDYDIIYDLNFDNIINVIDIIALINRILIDDILFADILDIEYDFQNLNLTWNAIEDDGFRYYNIYYSNIISNEEILIYSTEVQSDTSVVISNLDLKEQNWFIIGTEDFLGCEKFGNQYSFDLPYKNYDIDSLGNVINHSFDINQFDSAENCQACHSIHYEEWSQSMHAYTAHSPLFFSYKNKTIENHPEVGDKFCSQCHSPIAYLTDTDLSLFNSVEEFQSSNLDPVIKEGISCDVCHTVTGLSHTTYTPDNGAASATYKLYPGENIKFGPLDNPEPNNFHESFYLPTYKLSEQCLPCHDLVVRDAEAEITFTEWNRIPGFSMFGGVSCQQCHMPLKENGYHDHRFIGVDMDFSIPSNLNPLYEDIDNLLSSSAEIEFNILGDLIPNEIFVGDTLKVPLSVESLTAHSIPSGTSFNREAWIELTVVNNENIIYSSGLIVNTESLNLSDLDLLLFTSYLYDEEGNIVDNITEMHSMENFSLLAYQERYHYYNILIPENISGSISVNARLLFRPLKPDFINTHHPEFLENIPIFEIDSISHLIQLGI